MFHIFIEIRYFYQLIKIDPDVINGIVEKINQNVKENGGVSFSGNNPFHFCFDDTKIGGKFACVLTLSYVKELFEEYSGRIGEYTVLCFFSTESNEVVREEHLGEGGIPAGNAHQVMDRIGLNLSLDQPRDIVGAAHRNVDPKLLEHRGIFGVVDPGDGLFDPEDFFSQLAGDQVRLILTGYSDQRLTAVHLGDLEDLDQRAVPVDDREIQIFGQMAAGLFVQLNDEFEYLRS